MDSIPGRTSIDKGRTISLLFRLYGEECMFKDLLTIITNYATLQARMSMLRQEGLVCMEKIVGNYDRYSITLSVKGREVAELYLRADRMVRPSVDISEKSLDLRHADLVLRMLREHDYLLQQDLISVVHCHPLIVNLTDLMIADGLLDFARTDERCIQYRYSLTGLGRDVAEIYYQAYNRIIYRE